MSLRQLAMPQPPVMSLRAGDQGGVVQAILVIWELR